MNEKDILLLFESTAGGGGGGDALGIEFRIDDLMYK